MDNIYDGKRLSYSPGHFAGRLSASVITSTKISQENLAAKRNAGMIILAPVLGPLTQTIGMDPVHSGIMIVLSLNIGLVPPLVGACLFVICSITGIRLEALSKAIWPLILIEVAVLFLIAFFPQITLFVPHLLLGK